ncbi:hypothetical protein [Streptomyces sp. NPDC056405]|uniref:hypothetical protein n=1 Tax=Streptomyces sp. NPDC056405 TaxID=3345811 RepID=UPI0035D9EFE8
MTTITATSRAPAASARVLKEGTEALAPLLRANAAGTEADRKVAEEDIAAWSDAGLFRLRTPRRLDGHEAYPGRAQRELWGENPDARGGLVVTGREDASCLAGVRGTGSNTLTADEVPVPEHRVPVPRPAITTGGER